MGAVDNGANSRLIKLFSYINKNNEVSDVNTFYGQHWDEVKTDNETLNSIFKHVDNGDGIVQPQELNLLNKISLYIDNLQQSTAGNETLEKEELEKFAQQLESGEISIDQFKKDNETATNTGNWSEGNSRNIRKISIAKVPDASELRSAQETLLEELRSIGAEQGFDVEEIESGDDPWVEDSSIRRADGKIYVPYHSDPECQFNNEVTSTFVSGRGNVSKDGGTRVIAKGNSFDLNISNKDKVYGTAYLEGGNVLNTLSRDGKPSAVIGEGSIGATLDVMGLEHTPQNAEIAKSQIAKDLNLDSSNVTFIPQFDFHIDMLYRPLGNGKIAVPDFDEAIKLLENNQIPSMTNDEKQELISQLAQLRDTTKSTREEAEDNLKASGYEIVKIPSFTTTSNSTTNFMNGVGGTSNKTGQVFYITNKSEHPELQNLVEPYLKNAGIDKVYYVSTTDYLKHMGGIDCLTQEY